MSTSTPVAKVNISGFSKPDSVTSLDISLSEGSGSIQYKNVAEPASSLDSVVSIQGVKGVVNRSGSVHDKSFVGSVVSAEIGNEKTNNSYTFLFSEDESKYLPYHMSDIVSRISSKSGIAVSYKGYDLCVESYQFSGRFKDCLSDIASLVLGTTVYDSATDSYRILAGDYTSSSTGTALDIDSLNLLEYENYEEKDFSYLSFGLSLINLAKEIAKLRQTIIDVTTTTDTTTEHELKDQIEFKFGNHGGHVPIPQDVEVDSAEWDIWYVDELGTKYVNAQKGTSETDDPKFVSKQLKYFKQETLKETIVVADTNSSQYTVQRGKVRGLRSITTGTSLYFKLRNIKTLGNVKGRGYLINLATLGMPSLTTYTNSNQSSQSNSNGAYDESYHVLYELEMCKKEIKDNESNIIEKLYEPYIRFTCPVGIQNAVTTALTVKLGRAPNSFEVNNAMLAQAYSVHMELMGVEVDYGSLKYVGYQDKRGRVITTNNQVVLIAGLDNLSYYAPLEGMDINFLSTTQPSTAYNPKIFEEYFSASNIESTLELAYNDLKTLSLAQDVVCKATAVGYPKFLYETLSNQNGNIIGRVVGVVLGQKEPTDDLSINAFVTIERKKKRLERKLKTIECKINLIIRCLNKYSTVISLNEIKTHLRSIIEYEIILNEVKNESIQTMINLKSILEEHINFLLDRLGNTSAANRNKFRVKTVLTNVLPKIGDGVRYLDYTGVIKTINTSGLEMTIEGDRK